MNALNEVNKVITSVSYYSHRHGPVEEEEWLTAERMAVRILLIYHHYHHYHHALTSTYSYVSGRDSRPASLYTRTVFLI